MSAIELALGPVISNIRFGLRKPVPGECTAPTPAAVS